MTAAVKSLADWLSYQEQLHPAAIEMGLGRVSAVAERLQLRQAPPLTITVGGTNGKGSTTTLLAAIYREAGYRVGAYTSPHLFRYNERVAVDGEPVSDAALCEAFAAIELARAEISLSYFEFGTLAALWLFREARVTVQVLEVGLGGRLDAVNLLDADAAVVTNIGLDHMEWLGSDRDAIGREKAGIFRPGRLAVIADRDPPQGLLQSAAQMGAEVQRLDVGDFGYSDCGDCWQWQGRALQSPVLPLPALAGKHQLDNAAAAIEITQGLQSRLAVPWSAIDAALRALHLPGRLQSRGRFVLDVAHNTEAVEQLVETLSARFGTERCVLLIGVLADKPVEAMAARLRPLVQQAVTVSLPGPRAIADTTLAPRLVACGIPSEPGGQAADALALALLRADATQPILVCGSFLTVAAVAPLIANACPR